MRLRLDHLIALASLLLVLVVAFSMVGRSESGAADKPRPPSGSPFTGAGMWVWYVKSDFQSLGRQLQAAGATTVFIKAADGSRRWSQLNPELVAYLHGQGIHVCAWQYVYGNKPLSEARAAAAQVSYSGVNCFVIDAEEEYKHKAKAASAYISELRRLAPRGLRLGFTSFAYVNLHSSLPYKVFLGPGAAEANLPQMYWHEMGRSPARVVRETYEQNLRLGRPVYPIGQTYGRPPLYQLSRFTSELRRRGADGLSWWSLDHSSARQLERLRQLHAAYR